MTNLPEPSCPNGYTRDDITRIFPEENRRDDFYRYMAGQTVMICDGKTGEHGRYHSGKCAPDCKRDGWFKDRPCLQHCNHDEGDDFTWACEYDGTFTEFPSECADSPHGPVTYRCDVDRYFAMKAGHPVVWD